MAIQKISDLSILEPELVVRIDSESAENRLKFTESLIELSYPTIPPGDKTEYNRFQSMAMTIGTLSNAILADVINGDTTYYGSNHFDNPVYAHESLEISGNFYVNYDLPDDLVTEEGYVSYIKETQNIFVALPSDDPNGGTNILSATVSNRFYAGSTEFYSHAGGDDGHIADFLEDSIVFYKPLFGTDVTVENLTATNGVFTDLTCTNYMHGTAMSALWADLAEMYDSDDEYEPGTLVMFGGEGEITKATDHANGVVTAKPAFTMNSGIDCKHKIGLAMTGRTPVKVMDSVSKFDSLYLSPDIPGVAVGMKETGCRNLDRGRPIGIALSDKTTPGLGMVEAVVQLNI